METWPLMISQDSNWIKEIITFQNMTLQGNQESSMLWLMCPCAFGQQTRFKGFLVLHVNFFGVTHKNVRTLSCSRNLLPHQVHDCLTASSLLSQLELIYVLSAKHHKQNKKIERIQATLRIGTYPASVKSITDLPVKADKALIEADVALQYVDAGAKQSFKSVQVRDKIRLLAGIEKINYKLIQIKHERAKYVVAQVLASDEQIVLVSPRQNKN